MLNIQDLSDQKRGVKLVMKHLNFFTFLIFNFKILTKQTRKNSNDLERPGTTWNDLERPRAKKNEPKNNRVSQQALLETR